MTSSDVIVSWPAEAAVADWPQVKPVSPSFSSLDKMELPSGPKSHSYYSRRLPGQLQPRNCCFGLHIVVWAPGTRTWLGPPNPSGSRSGKTIPILPTAAAALSHNWTSNCVTASFHINISYSE